MKSIQIIAALAVAALAPSVVQAQSQGVSKTEILIGSIQDLSGPIAGVASLSKERALRTVNGSQSYSQWVFAPNVPFIVGGQAPVGGAPGRPNQAPSQSGLRAPDLEQTRVLR